MSDYVPNFDGSSAMEVAEGSSQTMEVDSNASQTKLTPEEVADELEGLGVSTQGTTDNETQDDESKEETRKLDKKKTREAGKLIELERDRTRRLKTRVASVKKTLDELKVLTGAKAELVVTYERPGKKLMVFRHPDGNDQTVANRATAVPAEAASEASGLGSSEDIRRAVSDGVKDAYKALQPQLLVRQDSRTEDDSADDTDASMASMDSQGIRRARGRRTTDPSSCFICKQAGTSIQFPTRTVVSKLVGCADASCIGKAHYYCLGLPQMADGDELDGKWRCSIHVVVATATAGASGAAATAGGGSSGAAASAAALFAAPEAKKRGRPAKATAAKPKPKNAGRKK